MNKNFLILKRNEVKSIIFKQLFLIIVPPINARHHSALIKLNKSFSCFHFDIYFKINLVLPLGFKVINLKNLHSKNLKRKLKYCNVNIFHLITSVIAEFPSSNFLCNILSLQRKIELYMSLFFLFSSLFGKIY